MRTTFDRAAAKVNRWIERHGTEPFSKQQCWQSIKGGTIKTSADLETVLGFLVDNELLVTAHAENGRRGVVYALPAAVNAELQYAEPGAVTARAQVAEYPVTPQAGPELATVTPISAANKEPLTAPELNAIRTWPGSNPSYQRARTILVAALERMGHGFGLTDLRPSHFTVAEQVELQRLVRGS